MADLLLAFCALAYESVLSLERIAALIGLAAHCTYSKQAFHQRLSSSIQHFMASAAIALFGRLSAPLHREGYFASFGRVLLHDSTVQSLPCRLAAVFPGSSNQKSKIRASLKIQWICDLLSGSLLQLSLGSFRRNDQAAAPDIFSAIRKNDLILRDLGYFSLPVLAQVHKLGAFFLSRFRPDVLVRDPQTKQVLDLLKLLQDTGRLDRWVLLGREQHLMRLVALPVTEELANRRRALARNNRDQRCAPSRQRLALMNWQLFVTNVNSTLWPACIVAKIYRLRWRIEIIFKSWKSHLRLHELNCRSAELVRLSVLLKLFYCLLTTCCCDALARLDSPGKQISLLRLARTLGHCGVLISAILLQLDPAQLLAHYLTKHSYYEPRADRKNFAQHLTHLSSA
jgi:hypothetical protein